MSVKKRYNIIVKSKLLFLLPLQPQRVMTHIVSKFERSLRPLRSLTHRGYEVAMEKLRAIQKVCDIRIYMLSKT